MCGISGFYSERRLENAEGLLHSMAQSLRHRGPDAQEISFDIATGVGLAHSRLAILELSELGRQPMQSASARLTITFNGEIYNYQDLKMQLETSGVHFRGRSDTEVLLEALDKWGVEETLKRCYGMFAFALFDRRDHTLTLARDRLGEKPLYYSPHADFFVFGSELKALRAFTPFKGEIDPQSVGLFLKYGYVPSPSSIYKKTYKLPPGTFLKVPLANEKYRKTYENLIPTPYWNLEESILDRETHPRGRGDKEMIDELESILETVIRQQMISDVPLGAFLSGGVDSSTVVALMQKHSSRPVKTFSIGFEDQQFNEAGYAKAVAKHLGTDHSELYVTPKDMLGVVEKLPQYYDEPFADSSQIPTYLVSKLAREQVTVSLSGDGGDELFGGYNRYFLADSIWRKIRLYPSWMRQIFVGGVHGLSPESWNKMFTPMRGLLPKGMQLNQFGDKLYKLADIFAANSNMKMYENLVSFWRKPDELVRGFGASINEFQIYDRPELLKDFRERMMYLDLKTYLPDDILAKVDRATMAVSLESRVPFLDKRVVEYAWGLPLDAKIRGNTGKWILRQVLDRYVPRELIERPKTGFGVPLSDWLRGPLKSWSEDLLSESALKSSDLFAIEPIRERWSEHLSGRRNWQYSLWNVLMFQFWRTSLV